MVGPCVDNKKTLEHVLQTAQQLCEVQYFSATGIQDILDAGNYCTILQDYSRPLCTALNKWSTVL